MEEVTLVVRMYQRGISDKHPRLVVSKKSKEAALDYIAEHAGLLPNDEYLTIMSQEEFNKTV